MKKLIIIITVINSIFCFAQQERSGKFKINAGIEYRIVPYFFKNIDGAYISNYAFVYEMSTHLAGNSINFEIEYFFLKNTTIGITQNFRYDELYTDTPVNPDRPDYSAIDDNHMRFISDTGIQLKHYFPLKNKNQFIIANLGYSFMNNNTTFRVNEVSGRDENGYPTYSRTGYIDWHFQAYKIGIGYKYKKLEAILGTYLVEKHNFEGYTDTGFGMPFLKINYNFFSF